MNTTDRTTSAPQSGVNLSRMSHRNDPHTSSDAAAKVKASKKRRLYSAIIQIIGDGELTPTEVTDEYHWTRDPEKDPEADLQEIRRRMTELEHDFGAIEPIRVGTRKGGKPQYRVEEGQRVMRVVPDAAKAVA